MDSIVYSQVDVRSNQGDFLPGFGNCPGGEVNPPHLPAVLGQSDHVGARPAADIQRPARRMVLNESEQLRRGLPGIPGRLSPVHPVVRLFPEPAHLLSECLANV